MVILNFCGIIPPHTLIQGITNLGIWALIGNVLLDFLRVLNKGRKDLWQVLPIFWPEFRAESLALVSQVVRGVAWVAVTFWKEWSSVVIPATCWTFKVLWALIRLIAVICLIGCIIALGGWVIWILIAVIKGLVGPAETTTIINGEEVVIVDGSGIDFGGF